MDISTFPAQLNAAFDRYTYFQDTTFSPPAASVRAFFRDVEKSATVLCAMHTEETTENTFQQSAVPFHNPFRAPGYEKRSIVIIDSHAHDLPVRAKQQNIDHPPLYIPANERFSIQSILGLGQSISQSAPVVDNDLHQPGEISNEACSASTASVAQDSVYEAKKKKCNNQRYRNDPDFAERQRQYNRERYKNDPDFAKRVKEYQKERRKDPAYVEFHRKYCRDRYRERYQNDPVYAERERERKRKRARERYSNNLLKHSK